LFLRQMESGHEFRTVKNRDLSEVVWFMLFMKNPASVPSVHSTEIFGQTEMPQGGFFCFYKAGSVHIEE